MTKTIESLTSLTENQESVLRHLVTSGVVSFTSADLSDLASVQHGKREWALPILRALQGYDLVELLPSKAGTSSLWKASQAGRELVAQAEQSPGP